jgi:hypothetical protein
MTHLAKENRAKSYDRELQQRRCKISCDAANSIACFNKKNVFFLVRKNTLACCCSFQCSDRRFGSRLVRVFSVIKPVQALGWLSNSAEASADYHNAVT